MVSTDPSTRETGYSPDEEMAHWGHIGRSTFTLLSGQQPAFGVSRSVGYGTSYECPPGISEILPVWVVSDQQRGGGQVLQMNLAADRQFRFSRLRDLAAELQAAHKNEGVITESDEEPDERLVELDWLVDQLLDTSSRLHSRGISLGLTDPDNVIYYFDRDSVPRLVLPDLFFCYRGAPPAPKWLTERGDYDFLWREASSTDEFDAWNYANAGFSAKRDMRLLARLLAWTLTGEKATELPQDSRYNAACWPLLRRALLAGSEAEHAIQSVADLQAGLRVRGHRISDHFRERYQMPQIHPSEPVKTSREGNGLSWLLMSAMAGGLGLAILMIVNLMRRDPPPPPPPPPQPHYLCKDCDAESPLHEILRNEQQPLVEAFRKGYGYTIDELDETDVTMELINSQFAQLEGQLEVLRKLYAALRADSRNPSENELNCVKSEAQRFLKCLGDHFRAIRKPQARNVFPDPVAIYTRFCRIYVSFLKQPFGQSLEKPAWHSQYVRMTTRVYQVDCASSSD